MFQSILNQIDGNLSVINALYCMGASIILGLTIAYVHMITTKFSKNFIITLCVLPLSVQVIIMMVNGNLGTSVAVLGAFSLIRFRSMPGNSREITSIFIAMAIGLAIGMGHIVFATVITIVISIFLIIVSKTKFAEKREEARRLKVVIPEDLDYDSIFDDLLEKYTKNYILEKVKTINMGSLYELTYTIVMNKEKTEKEFIDEIRCRNGNLGIVITRPTVNENEL